MNSEILVTGLYATQERAEGGIDQLKIQGFSPNDVSCIIPHKSGDRDHLAMMSDTKAAEGLSAGGAAGAAIGATLGWLAGAGLIAVPGIGPFLAAGPIMAALAGMGAGGAIGGITGVLVGAGIPEVTASRYTDLIGEGKVLVSVHCETMKWAEKAERILLATGATDVGISANTPKKTRSIRTAPKLETIDYGANLSA